MDSKNVVHETCHQVHKKWICQHNFFLYKIFSGFHDAHWVNDLNCFSPSSIVADRVAYVSFGKSVDGSLLLQIISF